MKCTVNINIPLLAMASTFWTSNVPERIQTFAQFTSMHINLCLYVCVCNANAHVCILRYCINVLLLICLAIGRAK